MTLHHKGQKYTSLHTGDTINAAHYYLEDDMRLVSAPNHKIGNEVGPWEVGLWFSANAPAAAVPVKPTAKSQTLYVDSRGCIHPGLPGAVIPLSEYYPDSIIKKLKAVAALPVSHQAAAVTADALSDWDGDHSHDNASNATARDKALTYDDGKAPLAYLPWAGIDAVADVQAYGHKKYHDFYNYRKGMEVGRNASCAIRHIRDFMNGQDNDTESGKSHLAHAACRLLFIIQNMADAKAIDDRYSSRKGAA